MAKYHLNPETGNPGLCRARQSCPFGDLVDDHYATAEAARAAYEASLSSFVVRHSPHVEALKTLDLQHLGVQKPGAVGLEALQQVNKRASMPTMAEILDLLQVERQALASLCLEQDVTTEEGLQTVVDARLRVNDIERMESRLASMGN